MLWTAAIGVHCAVAHSPPARARESGCSGGGSKNALPRLFDRLGRKTIPVVTMCLLAASSVAVMPTHGQDGLAASAFGGPGDLGAEVLRPTHSWRHHRGRPDSARPRHVASE